MDKETYANLLEPWHQAMWVLLFVAVALGIIILVAYWIRYVAASDYKSKYDLASASEVKSLLRSQYALAAGVLFVVNTTYAETVSLSPIWFFIRLFIGMCLATLYGYIALLVFKYYYPKPLHKKLEKLRYSPRTNPETGNRMKLLSEDEEDAYLDEGMQAEENAFSVDYDVWIDTQTGATHIEKYKGHLSALECDRCGFQTLKLEKEEIVKEATSYSDGEIQKEYHCSYCGRIKRKTVKLTQRIDKDASSGKLIEDPLAYDKRIDLVRLEIHGKNGEIKNYDFQNLDQARHFLEEFDLEKVAEEEEVS
ncbi:MAG: hypothetical protein KI790_11030 [Cyclobacteriaceae bacterium]|nr:hypothetical protein [Cyclobacteriaceae bacterium HetDA_MAG_MS6]